LGRLTGVALHPNPSPFERTLVNTVSESAESARGTAARLGLRWTIVAAIVAFGVMPAAHATPPCSSDAGPCDEPNGSPGCAETACCEAVCAFFTYCCEIEWDADCVEFRALFPDSCEGTFNPACGPGTGPCFMPHGTPGCEDPECCDQICAFDPFCCEQFWDFVCAGVASKYCPLWPCTVGCPEGALIEPEECGELLNEGCNSSVPAFSDLPVGAVLCGTVWADGGHRDTDWFAVQVPPTQGRALTSIVVALSAEPVVGVFLVDPRNCPLRQPIILKAAFGGGCAPTLIETVVQPGSYAVVVTPGLPSGPVRNGFECGTLNAYTLSVAVIGNNSECIADLTGDGVVDGADLGVLLNQWGSAGDPNVNGDLNGDGTVDGADLGILLNDWGSCDR